MNIRFIHTPKRIEDRGKLLQYQVMIPPLGIWSLADLATRYSQNVRIIHTGIETLRDSGYRLEEKLAGEPPDLVCFALHWHKQLFEVYEMSRAVKRACPDTRVLLGGITATAFAESIMADWQHVDYIIRGESEQALDQLLRNKFTHPGTVSNISWRTPDGMPVHNPVDYHAPGHQLDMYSHTRITLLQNHELYRGRYFYDASSETFGKWTRSARTWYLYIGRGCTVDCAFCGGGAHAHSLLSRRTGVSMRSPEAVASDITYMNRNHDTRTFYICFHPPGFKRGFYSKCFSLIRKSSLKPGMIFEYYNTVPDVSFFKDFADTFDISTSQLVFSPTAFTETARKRFCPSGFSDDDLRKLLLETEKSGLPTVFYYSPLPQEPLEELMRGLKFARNLLRRFKHLTIITMPIEIEPLSPWALEPKKHGFEPLRTSLEHYMVYHSKRSEKSTENDLGYRFPHFESVIRSISGFSNDPRWICFHPFIFDSFTPT